MTFRSEVTSAFRFQSVPRRLATTLSSSMPMEALRAARYSIKMATNTHHKRARGQRNGDVLAVGDSRPDTPGCTLVEAFNQKELHLRSRGTITKAKSPSIMSECQAISRYRCAKTKSPMSSRLVMRVGESKIPIFTLELQAASIPTPFPTTSSDKPHAFASPL